MQIEDKKIMFVVPSLEGGGAERVAANLLKGFIGSGIETVLVLFDKKHGYGIPDGVNVRYLNIGHNKDIISTVVKFFLIIFKLAGIIRKEKPFTILSFMDYTNIVVLLSNMLLLNRAKATVSVHTSPTLHLRKYSKNISNSIMSLLIRLLYKKADLIITVSDFIRDDFIENFGIDHAKITTIYNPVDTDKVKVLAEEDVFHPWFKDNIPVILSAGRLSREKGFDYLLKAFAVVKGKMNARLMILGEGSERENLEHLSHELGISENVFFAGFKENPYKYMKRAAIYVLSSLFEGFPNVIAEAMACGTPVISTMYNPSRHEIIEHGENGLLVPSKDELALAGAILKLLTDVSMGTRLACQARKKVEELSLENIMNQYKKVLLDSQISG